MFDFERLKVYEFTRALNVRVLRYLASNHVKDVYLIDQLRRATLSVALNLAEGVGRISPGDKKRFFVIARSSTFECVAILHILQDQEELPETVYKDWYESYEQISKMLLALYRAVN